MPSCAEQTLSVIVPVHNGGVGFIRCLSSLAEAMPPPDEIIVVVDGDTDGSGCLAEALGAKVLRMPARGGPACARNLGALTARGDLLFFVDADVAIRTDAISRIDSAFRCEPELVAVIGSYDDEPDAANFLSQYKNLLHHYVHQAGHKEASTFWGACGAIRREVFLALRGFDERYGQPSIEDIELGYRVKRAGYRIRLCRTLEVKHLKRWGVVSLLKSDFFHRALPWTELILRERQFINDLNLRRASRVSVMLTHGLAAALLGTGWWSGSLALASVLLLSLLALNMPLYRFFQRKRGLWFTIQAIPWHWFYYFYSGLAFAIGITRHMLHMGRSREANLSNTLGACSDKKRHSELS